MLLPSSTLRALALLGAVALVSACGDPDCPHGYQKIKNACFRLDAGDRELTSEEAGVSAATGEDASVSSGSIDAATQSGQAADSSTTPTATSDAAASAATNDAASTPPQNQAMADSGAPLASPECDATRSCAPGLVCSAAKCVSACTQTQCNANATCSLVADAPVCTCNRGFIAMGSATAVTCVRDVACEELGCDTNASCVVGSDQLRTCVCKNGYTGNGKSCAPVSCDAPTIENGTVSTSSGNTFGSTATYRCNAGYQQTAGGSWTRMCGANMQWGGTQPRCTAITCSPAPTNPQNGTVALSQGSQYGSIATYMCSPGYRLQGSSTRTCGAAGWSGSAPTCEATCGNGSADVGEQCDPTVAPGNVWNCDQNCRSLSTYNACPMLGTSTGCLNGEICFLSGCAPTCTSAANCPNTPAGTRVAPLCGANGRCVAASCTHTRDCAPGLVCRTQDGSVQTACTTCITTDSPSLCLPGTSCRAHGSGTAGFCQ